MHFPETMSQTWRMNTQDKPNPDCGIHSAADKITVPHRQAQNSFCVTKQRLYAIARFRVPYLSLNPSPGKHLDCFVIASTDNIRVPLNHSSDSSRMARNPVCVFDYFSFQRNGLVWHDSVSVTLIMGSFRILDSKNVRVFGDSFRVVCFSCFDP